MKALTRIELARTRLQAVAALLADQPDLLLRELQSCLANEVQNVLDNYGAGADFIQPIYWLLAAPLAEVPVSDFAVREFQCRINNWPPMTSPHEFLRHVASAVKGLIVYQIGWSDENEDAAREALWAEPVGEVVISDFTRCYRLSGEEYSGSGPFRPATKSELLACGLYNYHTADLLD